MNFFTVSNQFYYLVLRIVNMADDDVILETSDNDPKGGFVIRKKVIAVITKKVKSPLPVKFTAHLKGDTSKTFYINYKPWVNLKPINTKTTKAALTMTLTKNGESSNVSSLQGRYAPVLRHTFFALKLCMVTPICLAKFQSFSQF